MKTILGLDLGITSIGWALISENTDNQKEIIGLGSRIIPLSIDDKDEFSKGNAISKNQKRTAKRTIRKGYDRYQLRRNNLKTLLAKNNMLPGAALFNLSSLELYELRSKAPKEIITLDQLGRVLYLLNQKRGYKSSRSDANLDKKDTAYVAEVKNRHQNINDAGLTIGQYFYEELKKNEFYRIKQQVFPREAYIQEFEAICNEQKKHHPEKLTSEFIDELRDQIIYYQRKLKSQKGLVSVCEFEGRFVNNKDNKQILVGPKVAPKSSPLFQVCKIWETINTITLNNKKGETYEITVEQKQKLFHYLDNNDNLTQPKLFELLGLKKDDGWYGNKQTGKGLQGNLTKTVIQKILHTHIGFEHLLQFNLTTELSDKETYLANKKGGEIIATNTTKVISKSFEQEPLYRLWHTIYSIADLEECSKVLQTNFLLPCDIANRLAAIDFTKFAFGNKSAKAMRKIIPYLMEGYIYSNASAFAGYNHSNSLTKEENLQRTLLKTIPNLPKNSLRQPIVEKILNQMINLVNAVIEKHGSPHEIRIELARELKQSKDERNETFASLNKRERENKTIIDRIEKEYQHLGVRATRNTIIKWRLFHEINNDESKVNATCIYCGNNFGISDALKGSSVDVEHIIPKSKLFDDSQSNKTLVHRKCNEDKNDRTAYDFMESKGPQALQKYLETVNELYENHVIGKAKRDKLLMQGDKIPKNFIDRQLGETRYISRKSKEILESVCHNVWTTSGSVTEYLRRVWGWDDALMNLQMPKYRELGLTEWKEWETNDGQKHNKEIIKNWNKRNDHRHHAIDALAIACTEQGYIKRINTLSAQHNRSEMYAEVEKQKKDFREKISLLDRYMIIQRPFTTLQVQEIASKILISFKAGKKVATLSKYKATGKNIQTGVIVPRGPLSEESVYGKIKAIERNKPVKYLFENSHLILKPYIKSLVEERLANYNGKIKEALNSLKTEPVYLDNEKTKKLEYGSCFKEEYVIKYPIESLKLKDVEYIIDDKIKNIIKLRLTQFGDKEKEAFKDTVWYNEEKKIPIRSVRCFTGLSAVEPVKKDEKGKNIGFVKPGNNHHIAIYTNEKGVKLEHVCSFWHAVERKKYGFPIIIEHPKDIWDKILLNKEEYPQSFLSKLPLDNWIFKQSLQQNEMFILSLSNDEFEKAIIEKDKKILNDHLYRVQKLASTDYWFRHHLETELINDKSAKTAKKFYYISSISAFENLNPIKVRLNILGEIEAKGEECF